MKHTVTAAASSNSASRAQDFLREVGAPSTAKGYGSYAELAADPNVDIIYVATPHSHHYQNVMLCLNAGKNVLCEKAFTVNAAQARKLVDLAKEKGLFLMEAVWTRYFPLSIYVRELITSGKLGTVTRCFADLADNASPSPEEKFADGTHRMVNPDLAGGPLLDLGVYALNWVMQCLYHTQDPKTRQSPTVVSAVKRYEATGVDEMCTMLLTFPRKDGGEAHGVASTSIRAASNPAGMSDTPAVRVQGDKGEVQVYPMIYRPTKTRLILHDGTVEEKEWPQPGPGKGSGWKNGFGTGWNPEGVGHGMFWEADEAARGLVAGRKEGSFLGWDESVLIMEVCVPPALRLLRRVVADDLQIMDEVRKNGGIKYPEKIETLDYPVDL